MKLFSEILGFGPWSTGYSSGLDMSLLEFCGCAVLLFKARCFASLSGFVACKKVLSLVSVKFVRVL